MALQSLSVVTDPPIGLLYKSGTATAAGNTSLITPTSGHLIRLAYLSYGSDSNPKVTVAFRFGTAGVLFLRNSINIGNIVTKDFGDLRYVEGTVNQPLFLNLSTGSSILWNVFYIEVVVP
jgi:hypothetical protein